MPEPESSIAPIRLLDHPLAATEVAILRARETPAHLFRPALQRLSVYLLAEAARTWETRLVSMQSPLRAFQGTVAARPVALVPILRAGLGLQEGMMSLVPGASTGHIGLYRDPVTLRPTQYYSRLPADLAMAQVLVLDPMLATGQSATAAVDLVKAAGATEVQFVCVLACPPGVACLQKAHPDVPIIAAAIDPELNDSGYIVPGLGDAGDRYFGTD